MDGKRPLYFGIAAAANVGFNGQRDSDANPGQAWEFTGRDCRMACDGRVLANTIDPIDLSRHSFYLDHTSIVHPIYLDVCRSINDHQIWPYIGR